MMALIKETNQELLPTVLSRYQVDYYTEEVSYATVGVDTLALVNNIGVSRGARGMEEWVADIISAFSSKPLRSPRDVFIKWPRNYEQDNQI